MPLRLGSLMKAQFYPVAACFIVGCFAVVPPVDPARAQPKKTEDNLAAKIKCQDFQKNSDGKWTSGSGIRIGKMDFSGHTFSVGEVNIGGADLATVLNGKCAAK